MPQYTHILFDLDHTLWDYDRNAAEVLTELHTEFRLQDKLGVSGKEFVRHFFEVNRRLWSLHDQGLINKSTIREERFAQIFKRVGNYDNNHLDLEINQRFIDECPLKTNLLPNATKILEYLQDRYPLYIITNGFLEIQNIKMKRSGLEPYFKEVFISEVVGARKPDQAIFNYALNQIKATAEQVLMIGDNLNTDIAGARNAGIDQVFFNPNRDHHHQQVTFEIQNLLELKEIL